MDESFGEVGIDFLAELLDVDIDSVWLDVLIKAPDCFDNSAAGDSAVRAAHEEFEEAELRGSEWDLLAVATDFASGRVQTERAGAEVWDRRLSGAACDGTEAGEEDAEGERFDEVIVSASVEAGDDVVWGVAGGEHENGRVILGGAEAAGDFEAVDVRHHDVEDDGVEVSGGKGGEGLFTVAGEGDGVVLLLETLGEEVAHGGLVFSDEYPHGFRGIHSQRRRLRLRAQMGTLLPLLILRLGRGLTQIRNVPICFCTLP